MKNSLIPGVVNKSATTFYKYKHKLPDIKRLSHQLKNNVCNYTKQQIAADKKKSAPAIVSTDRDLIIASTALGLATAGSFYHPLAILSIPGLLWVSTMNAQDAYISYKKGRGVVNLYTLSTLFSSGTVLTGAYFAGSLGAFFVRLSKKMLAATEDNSVRDLVQAFVQKPRSVWLWQAGSEVEVRLDQMSAQDVIIVHSGEAVPCDGRVLAGEAEIDQSMLTGESELILKQSGDQVFAATLVLSGRLEVQVEKTGQDTIAANIGKLLHQTTEFKQQIVSWGEHIADRSARITVTLSALSLPLFGMTTALTLLNASFGIYMMALGPLSMLRFLSQASQSGILIKDGRSLQLLSEIDTVIFDKTGTLTEDTLQVFEIHSLSEYSKATLLAVAAAAEYRQSHPVALAILAAAEEQQLTVPEISQTELKVGYGVSVQIPSDQQYGENILPTGCRVRVGSARYMACHDIDTSSAYHLIDTARTSGETLAYIAINGQLAGVIQLQAVIRSEASDMVHSLQQRGLEVAIISGDRQQPTQQLAEQLGITTWFAEILPADKADIIQSYQQQGKSVCYIGDGMNDAIALKQANVSISLQGAAQVATDIAQILLLQKNLGQIVQSMVLAEQYKKTIQQTQVITTIPGVITVLGACFYGLSVTQSVMLNGLSLSLGAANTFRAGNQTRTRILKQKNQPRITR